jgi:hypothetical protein
MADAIIPFGHTGRFIIGAQQPGGQLLQALLRVAPNSSTVTGTGSLTQTINPPPPNSDTAFHGVVHVLGMPPGQAKQIYALHGVPVPAGFLKAYIMTLVICLDGVWGTKGTATYTWMDVHHHIHEVKDVPVAVHWLLQEG